MRYFLDVSKSREQEAKDLIKSETGRVPSNSWTHKKKPQYTRMEFRCRDHRNDCHFVLFVNNVECYLYQIGVPPIGMLVASS